MSKVRCELCPHHCRLDIDEVGLCRARINVDGQITARNYGYVNALALEPIEKKPLYHFYSGSSILSVGSFGCNLCCSFCQNHELSMGDLDSVQTHKLKPEALLELALLTQERGNIGIAYTYNEPLVGYEFVYDCAVLAHDHGLKNVLVTNGNFYVDAIRPLLPYIDAMNIDLKAFNKDFYRRIGGDLETVKTMISLAKNYCHIEVTTLIIPGENDSETEIASLAQWLASVDRDIPLHITRFFPNYEMIDRKATTIKQVNALANVAREILTNVYVGNC